MIGEALAILSAFCWAGGAAVYKKGLDYTDIKSGNLLRTSFTALGFIVIMSFNGKLFETIKNLNVELLAVLIVSAIFAFFIGDLCYLAALNRSGVSKTVPISSTYPLFVSLWSFMYGKAISSGIVVGSILIVIAIYLISKGEAKQDGYGIVFAILAAISWSISVFLLDYLTLYLPSEAVAGFRFLIVALLMSALSLGKIHINSNAIKWLGFGSMIVLVVGNYSFVEAIRLIGSAKVAPISATYPVISTIFARILKEKLTLEIVVGTLASFFGVLLVILS
ncbi:EamA family transporter [Archaeoglobales archaeon]|nr:MAG: EamA family transporter [Archaeoglobales archaeon]